jgi:hypothetical protein
MVSDEPDEMIEAIAARLRPLPEVDPAARARLLVAVAAERERDRERALRRRPRPFRWAGGAALAAAMVTGVLLLTRDRLAPRQSATGNASDATSSRGAAAVGADARPGVASNTLAARDAGGSTALQSVPSVQSVQLVFHAPAARRVSVVGDFTGWDPRKAPMLRDPGSGLWSVQLALPPGRHVYAFLVDDSVWVRDPRAPAAPDADFGRPGSVLLVGRP